MSVLGSGGSGGRGGQHMLPGSGPVGHRPLQPTPVGAIPGYGREKGAVSMSQAGARLLRFAVATAVTGVMVLATTGAAAVAAKPSSHSTPVVNVAVTTADGVSMPTTVHAGIVTFRFTQGDADYHAVQGFRLKPGGKLSDVMEGFSDALLGDFPTRVTGIALIDHGAVLIGGALTFPTTATSVTVSLEHGTYYFFDYADVGVVTPRIVTIDAVGGFQLSPLPPFSKVIIAEMQNGMPRFITPTSLSANGAFFFYNAADEDHEVMFRPTTPGITDDYITAFYDAVLAGGDRPPSPWTDIQHGLQPVSPGRWAIVHIDLPPGPYAEICYVPDDMTGIPHAYMGMHQIVALT
jgi:hypothetical protein